MARRKRSASPAFPPPSPSDYGVRTPPGLSPGPESGPDYFMSGGRGPAAAVAPSASIPVAVPILQFEGQPSATPAEVEAEALDVSMLDIDDFNAVNPMPATGRVGYAFQMVARNVPTLPTLSSVTAFVPVTRRAIGRFATFRPLTSVITKVTTFFTRTPHPAQPDVVYNIAAVPVSSPRSNKRLFLDINNTTEDLSSLLPRHVPGEWPEEQYTTDNVAIPSSPNAAIPSFTSAATPTSPVASQIDSTDLQPDSELSEQAPWLRQVNPADLRLENIYMWERSANPEAAKALLRYQFDESGNRIDMIHQHRLWKQLEKIKAERRASLSIAHRRPALVPKAPSQKRRTGNAQAGREKSKLKLPAALASATPQSDPKVGQAPVLSDLAADPTTDTNLAVVGQEGTAHKQPLILVDDHMHTTSNGQDGDDGSIETLPKTPGAFPEAEGSEHLLGGTLQLHPQTPVDNDMSTLEDAPPRKSIRFHENSFKLDPTDPTKTEHAVLEHVRYFHGHMAIAEQDENRFGNQPPRLPHPAETLDETDLEDYEGGFFAEGRKSPQAFPDLSNQSPKKKDEDDGIAPLLGSVTREFENWHWNGIEMSEKKRQVKDERERLAILKKEEEAKRQAAEAKRKAEEEAQRKAEAEEAAEKQRLLEKAARDAAEAAAKAKEAARPIIFRISKEAAAAIDAAAKQGPNGMHAMSLKGRNFGSLLPTKFAGGNPQAWLDDEIVNTYLKLLAEREQELEGWKKGSGRGPPVQAIASQWYTNVKGKNKAKFNEDKPAFDPKEFESVRKWHTRAGLGGKRLLDTKLIVIPICEGNHWRLLAIKPQLREIELLDSLNPAKRAYEHYVHLARRFLECELGALYVANEWTHVPNRSGHQGNARDCGVFTAFNALALVKGVEPAEKVTSGGMPTARLQLAGTLLRGGFKGEFDY